MSIIEIETIEGGRLQWVAISSDTNTDRLINWANNLTHGVTPPPNLRILTREQHRGGTVIATWQDAVMTGPTT